MTIYANTAAIQPAETCMLLLWLHGHGLYISFTLIPELSGEFLLNISGLACCSCPVCPAACHSQPPLSCDRQSYNIDPSESKLPAVRTASFHFRFHTNATAGTSSSLSFSATHRHGHSIIVKYLNAPIR